jgi:hypothetical protein
MATSKSCHFPILWPWPLCITQKVFPLLSFSAMAIFFWDSTLLKFTTMLKPILNWTHPGIASFWPWPSFAISGCFWCSIMLAPLSKYCQSFFHNFFVDFTSSSLPLCPDYISLLLPKSTIIFLALASYLCSFIVGHKTIVLHLFKGTQPLFGHGQLSSVLCCQWPQDNCSTLLEIAMARGGDFPVTMVVPTTGCTNYHIHLSGSTSMAPHP